MRRDLVDRDVELALLDGAVEAARAGAGRLVILEGPAGSGKSALIAALREGTGSWLGLHAAGGEFEQTAAFAVVRELLGAAPKLEQALGSGAAMLAAPLFDPAAAHAGVPDVGALFHGLYWLIAGLAERRPLLLTIDDLQWADSPSAQFMTYLAPRLDGLAVVVVAAWRPGEPRADERLLDRLLALPATLVARPGPLSLNATRCLLETRLDRTVAPELIGEVHRASAGNAFLLHELIEALLRRPDGELPATPERVLCAVRARLDRLSVPARTLADSAAVLGRDATLSRAAEHAGLDRPAAAAAFDTLVAADVLTTGQPMAFAHPLVRHALYDALPAGRRVVAHTRAAHVLAGGSADAEQVGRHLLEIEPSGDAWVTDALLRAASSALRRAAPEIAVIYGRRALEEPPTAQRRIDVLMCVADAEARSRDSAAFAHLDEAYRACEEPARRLEIAVQRAHSVMGSAAMPDEFVRLSVALEQDGTVADAATVAFAAALLLQNAMLTAPHRLGELAARADSIRRQSPRGVPRRVLAAFLSLWALSVSESCTQAFELGLEAIGDELDHAENLVAGWQLSMAAFALAAGGGTELARQRLDISLRSARQRGAQTAVFNCLWMRARVTAAAGELASAEADALEALALSTGDSYARLFTGLAIIDALRDRNPARAVDVLEELDLSGELPLSNITSMALVGRARLALALAQPEHALRDARGAEALVVERGIYHLDGDSSAEVLAEALLANGEVEEATVVAAEACRRAEVFGGAGPKARALRVTSLTAPPGRRAEALRRAVPALAASQRPVEHVRGLIDLGAALRRAGERAAAREPLAAARERAHRYGATHLEQRALTELRATGARPRGIIRRGRDALTPSELRVAQMAALGGTNRVIAQQLFVTEKTVETHLSASYRKLDITSRRELSAVLAA